MSSGRGRELQLLKTKKQETLGNRDLGIVTDRLIVQETTAGDHGPSGRGVGAACCVTPGHGEESGNGGGGLPWLGDRS